MNGEPLGYAGLLAAATALHGAAISLDLFAVPLSR
jgi:hypothetical protein